MKKLFSLQLCIATVLSAYAVNPADVAICDASMTRQGDAMNVALSLDLHSMDIARSKAVLFTPFITNGTDTVALQPVGIYGRTRYYQQLRHGTDGDLVVVRDSERPDTLVIDRSVPYVSWMNGASLRVRCTDIACCNKPIAEFATPDLSRYAEYEPRWVFVQPDAEREKHFELSGSAFIDFPVDQTVIYPEYRRNTVELAKVQATIDSLRGDGDITVTNVWLKGFASPESPYSHNRDLAIGRTAALKAHIMKLYNFPDQTVLTDYEPEDWAGLRRAVLSSNLDNRDAILALIDSDMEPDAKEARIKKLYPADYRFMLNNFYPALRHTDYRIEYNVRRYTDIDEIKRILRERPNHLSLNELYLVAQSFDPQSDEYIKVFETAAAMFPDAPDAHLNAANAAMKRGDLTSASRYLAKAGDSPQADYARGVLFLMQDDIAKAAPLMRRARRAGITEADSALEYIDFKSAK